jgi:hypothetical protein
MVEFVHPGVLWALPAALLPVVIHLLNRRRYRTVRWAAMPHLLRAEERSRRRVRWQDFIVLLLRTGAVLLLVLLFARPVLSRPLPGPGGGPGARTIVLLDDSASMAHDEGEGSAFERGKAFALLAARRAGERGLGLSLYLAGGGGAVFGAEPGAGDAAAQLEERLSRLGPIAGVFEPVTRLPELGAAATEGAGDLNFFVVTDLRSADWGAEQLRRDVAGALEALRRYGAVTVVDVGREPTAGLAVRRLAAPDSPAYAGERLSLRAEVANDAGRPADVVLEVELGGALLPPVAAGEVPGGQTREVPVGLFLGEAGYHTVSVVLRGEDSFAPDDRRFIVLEAVTGLRALVVDEGGRGEASFFLRAALQPARGVEGGIEVIRRRAGAGPPGDLDRYAAVFLCDVPSPAAWREALERYARGGGRVVAFMGGGTDAEAWNGSLLGEKGLLPCRLDGVAATEPGRPIHLGALDAVHPWLRPFAGWETLLGMARVRRFARLTAFEGARVLARFDDEAASPAIVAAEVGRGLLVLIATSADDAWTDWPRSEAGRVTYVAMMQRLVEFGRRPDPPALNLVGGERVELALEAMRFAPTVRLVPPEGADVDGLAVPQARVEDGPGGERRIVGGPLRRAGFWEVRLTGADGRVETVPVAVNVHPHETRLERAGAEAAAAIGEVTGSPVLAFRGGAEVLAQAQVPAGRAWWALAAVVLVMLLAEGALASFFGSPPGGRKA